MKEKNIKLLNVDEVKQFVSAAIQCDFDVDVYYNRVIIDAKSILGGIQPGSETGSDCPDVW